MSAREPSIGGPEKIRRWLTGRGGREYVLSEQLPPDVPPNPRNEDVLRRAFRAGWVTAGREPDADMEASFIRSFPFVTWEK